MTDSDNFYSEKKKSPNSDRSGAVAGTTSLTQPDSIANLQKNTINALLKIKIIKRVGVFAYISDKDDANSIVRKLGKNFGLIRSDSSNSYYEKFAVESFENEIFVNDKKIRFRLSTHLANGDRFAQDSFFDERISVVVFKNGEHRGTNHEKFTEFVYEPSKMTNIQIADSIIDGFESLLYGKGFYDKLGIVKPKEYSITNGIIQSEPSFKSTNVIKQSEKQSKKNQNKI